MRIALTFDDGPGASTADLLKVLRSHGCAATFFVLGENVTDPWWSSDGPDAGFRLLGEAVKEGHVLGNHTVSHNGRIGLKQLVQEVAECDQMIRKVYECSGLEAPSHIPLRLPFGIRAHVAEYVEGGRPRHGVAMDHRLAALASMGRSHMHWTHILPDWQARSSKDVDVLYQSALDHIWAMHREGIDVVLALHDGRQKLGDDLGEDRRFTVDLVDGVLREAKKQRWELWTVGGCASES